MSFFKNAYQKMKDKVFGAAPDVDPVEQLEEDGLDIGPAKRWYVKRLFHRSIFTKKLTPSREKEIREVFRRLRPEQRAIALKRNWNRGLDV
jgi:hypothetical protein